MAAMAAMGAMAVWVGSSTSSSSGSCRRHRRRSYPCLWGRRRCPACTASPSAYTTGPQCRRRKRKPGSRAALWRTRRRRRSSSRPPGTRTSRESARSPPIGSLRRGRPYLALKCPATVLCNSYCPFKNRQMAFRFPATPTTIAVAQKRVARSDVHGAVSDERQVSRAQRLARVMLGCGTMVWMWDPGQGQRALGVSLPGLP